MLPYCDRAYITKVHISPISDTFFPNLDKLPNWKVAERSEPVEENGLTYRFIDYVNTAL